MKLMGQLQINTVLAMVTQTKHTILKRKAVRMCLHSYMMTTKSDMTWKEIADDLASNALFIQFIYYYDNVKLFYAASLCTQYGRT